ncbi:MAG: hypothetical protein JO205_06435, partial [Pseudolabrys sp.]|nr:hypothetical protein [Pseudolabrys sp.]
MVRGRRSFVTGLAALAAAGPALSQTFTATSISQAAQDARRDVGVLSRRAADLLRATAADGYERGGNAVRRFRSDGASLARELAAVFNGRVSEDDWLLVVPTSELDLALAMRPLLIRLAPTKDQVEAALKQPLPQLEGQNVELGTAEDVLLAIVLACLDVPRGKELMARLRSDSALDAALQAATAAIKAHRYGLAALELE